MGVGRNSFVAWSEHLGNVPVSNRRPEFVRDRYWIDTLPPELAEILKSAIEGAPPPAGNECAPDCIPSLIDPAHMELLRKEHAFRALDAPTVAAYRPVLDWLKPRVAEVVGAPWAILNVRSWTTPAGPTTGPNAWHRDGMPKEMFKIMLYLTPVGDGLGGIELGIGHETIRTIHGPAGTWLLFYNSVIQHRGVAPTQPGFERVASEITLIASREFDLELRFLGLNARYRNAPPQ